ncbi:MAG: hypothetical protein AAFY56_14740 [Pseudomonadota bacterium]
MRKSDLKKNHAPFEEAVARYRTFLQKIIDAKRVVGSAQEKRDIAESVLLRLCANWERFVDDHLVCCVNRDHAKLSEFLGVTIPAHPSKDLCYALIFGDGYRDFPSFGKLKGFSKKILVETSNPFLEVSKTTSARIDEVYAIRNYLAHYSFRSRRALLAMYKKKYEMTRFLEPGQFLLAYSGDRLWKYFRAFESASNDMKKWY